MSSAHCRPGDTPTLMFLGSKDLRLGHTCRTAPHNFGWFFPQWPSVSCLTWTLAWCLSNFNSRYNLALSVNTLAICMIRSSALLSTSWNDKLEVQKTTVTEADFVTFWITLSPSPSDSSPWHFDVSFIQNKPSGYCRISTSASQAMHGQIDSHLRQKLNPSAGSYDAEWSIH